MNLKWEAHGCTRILKLDVDNALDDAVSCVHVLIIVHPFFKSFFHNCLFVDNSAIEKASSCDE